MKWQRILEACPRCLDVDRVQRSAWVRVADGTVELDSEGPASYDWCPTCDEGDACGEVTLVEVVPVPVQQLERLMALAKPAGDALTKAAARGQPDPPHLAELASILLAVTAACAAGEG